MADRLILGITVDHLEFSFELTNSTSGVIRTSIALCGYRTFDPDRQPGADGAENYRKFLIDETGQPRRVCRKCRP